LGANIVRVQIKNTQWKICGQRFHHPRLEAYLSYLYNTMRGFQITNQFIGALTGSPVVTVARFLSLLHMTQYGI